MRLPYQFPRPRRCAQAHGPTTTTAAKVRSAAELMGRETPTGIDRRAIFLSSFNIRYILLRSVTDLAVEMKREVNLLRPS
jgi:hypothetical protein